MSTERHLLFAHVALCQQSLNPAPAAFRNRRAPYGARQDAKMSYAQHKKTMLQELGGAAAVAEFHAASHDEVEEGLGLREADELDSSEDLADGGDGQSEFDSDASAGDFSGDDAIHVMI